MSKIQIHSYALWKGVSTVHVAYSTEMSGKTKSSPSTSGLHAEGTGGTFGAEWPQLLVTLRQHLYKLERKERFCLALKCTGACSEASLF